MSLWKKGAAKWRKQTSSNEKVALALHLESNHPDKIGKIRLDYLSVMVWPLSSTFIIQLIFPEFQGYILCRKLATQVSHVISSIQSPERRVSWYNILAPVSSSPAFLKIRPVWTPSWNYSTLVKQFTSFFIIMRSPQWYGAGPVLLTCPCDVGPKWSVTFSMSWVDVFERVKTSVLYWEITSASSS